MLQTFPLQGKVYRSAPISRNLLCPEKFLVVRLHIYDISNLIFVHWNCIDSTYKNLGGLVVWYLKRWSEFDSQQVSILSTVNYLQLMIYFWKLLIKHIWHRFSSRISDPKFFSAMLHQNIVRQNKFFNFSPNFLHSFMLIWPFQKQFHFSLYLQGCKLGIVNSQIKIFQIMLLRQLNFGVLLV